MGTRVLELDTIQYPSASTENIQVGNNSVTFPSGISVDINGGAIDGTPIGAGTASTGAFTTLSTTGAATLPTVNIDGGNIDGSTIATSDITVGSSKTLDVSGGTLTTSTAQKQAVVDGATIEAQDLATGSGTTLPNAVQDNITRLGSVTQGTIGSGVTQDGVVRLIKIAHISIDENQSVSTTNEYVPHNAFSVSVVSGKTYLIETNVSMKLRDTGNSGIVSSFLRLYADTTDRSKGDNAATSSTQAYSGMVSAQSIYLQSGSGVNNTFGGINLKGAFTAGSTETRYIYFTHSMSHSDDRVYPEYMSNYVKQVYFVYEVTGVSITTNP
jgi:hypothetical protein